MGAFSQNYELGGLTSNTTSVPLAGTYLVQGKLSLPTLVGGAGASAVVTTISQNGSPVYTGPAGAEGFTTTLNVAASDTILVALTSAAAPDNVPNAVKATVSIG